LLHDETFQTDKETMKTLIILTSLMLLAAVNHAQVAINNNGNNPAASAMLDVTSTTRGILVPRMTSTQRSAIASPATGLMVYQTNAPNGYYYYNGTIWKQAIDAAASVSNPPANNLLTFDGTNWVAKNLLIGISGSGQPFSIMQPYLCLNYCIAIYGIYPQRNGADPFIGELELFGFDFAPNGFAKCDGQYMSIAENSALFSLLGTYYGGDGVTIFALPDLRGRVPIHQGQGPGLTPRTLGERSGSEYIYLTAGQLPAHTHTVIYQ
jgi:microcystin-dependent protein